MNFDKEIKNILENAGVKQLNESFSDYIPMGLLCMVFAFAFLGSNDIEKTKENLKDVANNCEIVNIIDNNGTFEATCVLDNNSGKDESFTLKGGDFKRRIYKIGKVWHAFKCYEYKLKINYVEDGENKSAKSLELTPTNTCLFRNKETLKLNDKSKFKEEIDRILNGYTELTW